MGRKQLGLLCLNSYFGIGAVFKTASSLCTYSQAGTASGPPPLGVKVEQQLQYRAEETKYIRRRRCKQKRLFVSDWKAQEKREKSCSRRTGPRQGEQL